MGCTQNEIEEAVQRFREKLESGYFTSRNHHKPSCDYKEIHMIKTNVELHQYCGELELENEKLRAKIKSMEQENEGEIRAKIAGEVEEKMMYTNTCLNERDIILGIILGKRILQDLHCNTDCKNDECKLYKNLEIKN